jgi:hypothetical protein
MIEFHQRDERFPDADEVLDALATRAAARSSASEDREWNEVVRAVVVRRLIELANSPGATAALRMRAERSLTDLAAALPDDDSGAFWNARIGRFLQRDHGATVAVDPADGAPPGSPIGNAPPELLGCGHAF